jgi:hypothetical protein
MLIKVQKEGEISEIHPTTWESHRLQGWELITAETAKAESLTVEVLDTDQCLFIKKDKTRCTARATKTGYCFAKSHKAE